MEELKNEFKKLYSDDILTDFEAETMAKRLIQFCTLLVKQYQSQKNVAKNEEKETENTK